MYTIRNGAIRWQIHDFLSDANSNFCSFSHHLRNTRNSIDTSRDQQPALTSPARIYSCDQLLALRLPTSTVDPSVRRRIDRLCSRLQRRRQHIRRRRAGRNIQRPMQAVSRCVNTV